LQRHGYIRYEDLPLKTHEGVAKQVEFVSNSYLAGSIRVIQCNIRDITERRRAEKALLESQRRLDFALQKSHTGGWDLDLVDLTLHRTLEHDRIFGYSTLLPEWTYEMFLEHVLPEDRTEVDRRFRQAVATQTAWSFECRIRRPDGDVRWIWASGEHQGDRNGKPERLSGIVQDITERKRAEEALRSKIEELAATTQQLWQASKLATMGELAASIAHELNNPLATVGLRTESLLMQLPEESDQRKPLEIISQEVDRMATLVNNLLQFSRRSHRQVSTVDPREEIATSVEFVQYHLRSHNIEVVREFADVLPSIQADRQQLRQLFLNLLTNASDAMPQGGKLTVRAGSNGFGDAAVAIDFADSGEGITSENLERVWDPFFTTKPEGKGTGLGLAICRRIVEEHGGTISIQSGGTDGTTVRIVLPATGSGGLS
jgi:PAS domain S-box-containing protein